MMYSVSLPVAFALVTSSVALTMMKPPVTTSNSQKARDLKSAAPKSCKAHTSQKSCNKHGCGFVNGVCLPTDCCDTRSQNGDANPECANVNIAALCAQVPKASNQDGVPGSCHHNDFECADGSFCDGSNDYGNGNCVPCAFCGATLKSCPHCHDKCPGPHACEGWAANGGIPEMPKIPGFDRFVSQQSAGMEQYTGPVAGTASSLLEKKDPTKDARDDAVSKVVGGLIATRGVHEAKRESLTEAKSKKDEDLKARKEKLANRMDRIKKKIGDMKEQYNQNTPTFAVKVGVNADDMAARNIAKNEITFDMESKDKSSSSLMETRDEPLTLKVDAHGDFGAKDNTQLTLRQDVQTVHVQEVNLTKAAIDFEKSINSQKKIDHQYQNTYAYLKKKQGGGDLRPLTPLQEAILKNELLMADGKEGWTPNKGVHQAGLLQIGTMDVLQPHVLALICCVAVIVVALIMFVASRMTSTHSGYKFAAMGASSSDSDMESEATGSTERELKDRMDRFQKRLDDHKRILEEGSESEVGTESEATFQDSVSSAFDQMWRHGVNK